MPTPYIKEYVKKFTEKYTFDNPVLNLGAGPPEQQVYTELFVNREYLQSDFQKFKNIDILCDIYDMKTVHSGSVGLVLCLEILEHLLYPQKAIDEVYRIIKPNGFAIVTCSMRWEHHPHPKDYWRFCPDGLLFLLKEFKIVDFTIVVSNGIYSSLEATVQKTNLDKDKIPEFNIIHNRLKIRKPLKPLKYLARIFGYELNKIEYPL